MSALIGETVLSKVVGLRLDPALYERLLASAKQQSPGEILRTALRVYLSQAEESTAARFDETVISDKHASLEAQKKTSVTV